MLDVALLGVGMAIVATLLWLVYRTMDHPRLPVISSPDAAPRATWSGVARYALLTPFLVFFWMGVLLLLITAVARERSPEQIVVAASAVIAGARLMAHINSTVANELAKTVPIVMLGVVIIGGQLAGVEGFERTFNAIPWDATDSFSFGLVVWDYLLTAIWFVVLRRRWQRRDEPPGRVARIAARWQQIGYGSPASGGQEALPPGPAARVT